MFHQNEASLSYVRLRLRFYTTCLGSVICLDANESKFPRLDEALYPPTINLILIIRRDSIQRNG